MYLSRKRQVFDIGRYVVLASNRSDTIMAKVCYFGVELCIRKQRSRDEPNKNALLNQIFKKLF